MMNMQKLGTVSLCYGSLIDKQKATETRHCIGRFIHYAYLRKR